MVVEKKKNAHMLSHQFEAGNWRLYSSLCSNPEGRLCPFQEHQLAYVYKLKTDHCICQNEYTLYLVTRP
jgi:hypothetical protein